MIICLCIPSVLSKQSTLKSIIIIAVPSVYKRLAVLVRRLNFRWKFMHRIVEIIVCMLYYTYVGDSCFRGVLYIMHIMASSLQLSILNAYFRAVRRSLIINHK